jgi:hypothetical protein
MILEQFCVANVAAQGINGLVTGDVHHLEN